MTKPLHILNSEPICLKKVRFVAIVLFIVVSCNGFFFPVHAASDFEESQSFGVNPLAKEQSKGRNIQSCLAGFRQFISAGIGYESFKDYFRDFLLWPSHYADVANVENQLNKARYAVMSAYLRCDLKPLEAFTRAYYKLEAELHFVRHYVDTDGGFLHLLTENPGEREKFSREIIDALILRKKSTDENADRALFGGYFDEFVTKYKEKAKQYKNYGDDPVYKELGAKFDQLIDTFKSFGKVSDGVKEDEEKKKREEEEKKKKQQSQTAATPSHEGTLKNIREAAIAVASKFNACVDTSDNRFCMNPAQKKVQDPFVQPAFKPTYPARTYEDVQLAITKRELQQTEDLDKAEMLTRYELLYGQVNGDGIIGLTERIDKLLVTLGKENAEAGSLKPLGLIETCSKHVLETQCK